MAERDVWILGASMTKFGRYPDKDLIDLGADAALAALDDAGVTMANMDVMGAGNLMEAASGVGQRIQKQVGQNGVPVYNVANACATGATAIRCVYMAIKSGEADTGIAVGLEKMGKAGLLGSAPRSDKNVFEPSGRYGSVMSVVGRVGPTGDGSAALVLVAEEKLASLSDDQRKRAVKISASVMTSDPWTETDQVQPDVNTLTRDAANQAYESAGVDPSDLDLVELHDCFATAELIHYDNLGLCKPGEAGKFIDERGPWRDGETPVNASGGLISKGHPLGATGVANLYEVATHLRGEAGDRQIDGAKVGLTHVIGLGSACAVHVLEKAAV